MKSKKESSDVQRLKMAAVHFSEPDKREFALQLSTV
jgi:hypothetical protein